jgi:hypothetical protein
MLSVLRHLNYKAWYALAEFVDNALQSYIKNKEALQQIHGPGFRLKVAIEISQQDGGTITIRDNAGGIPLSEYERAFRPAAVPLDRSGLSEFGMGMKSAACWFSREWYVRTSALGEAREGEVRFDIASIVEKELEDLDIIITPAEVNSHYTEVVLRNLYKVPQGRTLAKIKEHLASIYRIFIREGEIELFFNREALQYNTPAILQAPFYKDPEGMPVQWLKEVSIPLSDGRKVYGMAAIRAVGSTSDAGFALFRRRRLIEGSADEAYRPEAIFGKSNSFAYQRLFGELHFVNFGVSHTKDGLQWDDVEEGILAVLREQLDEQPLPLLTQAREYRLKPKREDLTKAVTTAITSTVATIQREGPRALEQLDSKPPVESVPLDLEPVSGSTEREIEVVRHGRRWIITLEASDDPSIGSWVDVFERDVREDGAHHIGVRLALSHPFTQRFASADATALEPLLRIAAALALAETAARESGVRLAGTIRRNFNELLREAFWKT